MNILLWVLASLVVALLVAAAVVVLAVAATIVFELARMFWVITRRGSTFPY